MISNFTSDASLRALFWPFTSAMLDAPDGPVAFFGARPGHWQDMATDAWRCEQGFRPFAEALEKQHLDVVPRLEEGSFSASLILPPRSRDARRAVIARAVTLTSEGGRIIAAASNEEGGRSLESDLQALLGDTGKLSKHKCRIAVATRSAESLDEKLLQQWLTLGDLQQKSGPHGSFWTRPGLFAWDRVDPASALLAQHLPDTLSGRFADLGTGWGFLAMQVAARCPGVTSMDLFEAQADALEPARRNLQAGLADRDELPWRLHWHDVTAGLPGRYDVVISNPPFHIDRTDQPALGQAFIRRAAESLTGHGEFWMVANRHLPYETALERHFQQHDTLAEQSGFKVIRASRPTP